MSYLKTHFGISEGKGGVKTQKPSVVGYGYFLELPNSISIIDIIVCASE